MNRGLNLRSECITRADRMNETVIRLLKERFASASGSQGGKRLTVGD